MACATGNVRREIPQIESINRISKIPVVETGVQYAKFMYGKIKNSNTLMQWSFNTMEGGIQKAIDKSLIAVPIIEMPLNLVDTIVCKSLDSLEHRVPAINYPTNELLNMTKLMVSTRIVQPVIKRADSVKQFGVQGASKYGEMAASHIDTALDVADLYVDKYLPDATDNTDSTANFKAGESKTVQTIDHVNRLSKKFQRRLTKRTLAEARALRKQGADTVQVLLHLMEMAIKDPKQFVDQMKTVWSNLSKDEPGNQIPPANLEQLIAMLTRESARRLVHLTNFTYEVAKNMPTYTRQTIHVMNIYTVHLVDYVNKTANLERVKELAFTKFKVEIDMLHHLLRQLQSQVPQIMDKYLPNRNNPTPSLPPPPVPETSAPTQTQDKKLIPQEQKQNNAKQNNKSVKEVETSSNKKESKKKKTTKDVVQNEGDENYNKPAVENGSVTPCDANGAGDC